MKNVTYFRKTVETSVDPHLQYSPITKGWFGPTGWNESQRLLE